MQSFSGRNVWAPTFGVAAVFLAGLNADPAAAQSKLEAQYQVTLGGLPIGSGSWTVDVVNNRYTMAANGKAAGLLQVFAPGSGTASAHGAIQAGKLSPESFAVSVRSRNRFEELKMGLLAGAVKSVLVQPPPKPPTGNRVPLTDAHKRGVIDPISAGILERPNGSSFGPDVCKRTFPVFDGHQRFDLSGSFKRMETVKTAKGYEGPVVVCRVQYTPVAGHDPDRFAVKFLKETRDIEVWYAPIAGTRFVAVYRISVPTTLGAAVMYATRFVVAPIEMRAGLTAPRR